MNQYAQNVISTPGKHEQIAADLGTVEKTVKVHRGRVMEKLKAASVADLVRLAQRAGIHPA